MQADREMKAEQAQKAAAQQLQQDMMKEYESTKGGGS
jgi:hypothetical protein